MSVTVVIANPHAGSGDEAESLARIAKNRHRWRWEWTRTAHDATRLARQAAAEGADRIVAAGGDGTVHLVVQGILATSARPTLAVLPIGTGNDLVRTLGFGTDPEEVLDQLARGTDVRAMDLARAHIGHHRRVMVNGSAAGFSAAVDRALDPEAKARWGAWAYMRGALEVIGDLPSYRLALEVDGDTVPAVECVGLTLTNGRSCGGGLQVAPTADLEDGLLDLLVVERASKLALAGVAAQLRAGSVLESRYAHHGLGASVELSSDPPMPFNIDGELLGDVDEASFEVLPRELPVAVGPDYELERGGLVARWAR